MSAEEQVYYVTFRETHIVTERVFAHSGAEAVRLVKDGLGERTLDDVDEHKGPTAHRAEKA